jgi:hypothetical protein
MRGFWPGVFGGFVAWVATMIVGHPLYRFVGLRGEVAKVLHLYCPSVPDGRATEERWKSEREAALRTCTAQLSAFAVTERIPTAIVKVFRLDLQTAAENLNQLAAVSPQNPDRTGLRANVETALKIRSS